MDEADRGWRDFDCEPRLCRGVRTPILDLRFCVLLFQLISMVLFASDLHLGRLDPAADRRVERDFVDMLKAHEAEVEALYLLGDVFDYYIEYRHVVPKGYARLQGLLAEWTDAGIPVTYVVGNHDPWHERYFQDELGVHVVFDEVETRHYGRRMHLAHGDLIPRGGRLRRTIEQLLRHPVPVWVYKRLLPADLGIFLARSSSRALQEGDGKVNAEVVECLRAYAQETIDAGRVDLVVLGHAHQAEHTCWASGSYINTGCWYRDRTFARMTANGPELFTWDHGAAIPVEVPVAAGQL